MEEDFVILKYHGRAPTLAMCRKCKVKFFTVHVSRLGPIQAEQYLWEKFSAHDCKVAEFPSRHWRSRRAV